MVAAKMQEGIPEGGRRKENGTTAGLLMVNNMCLCIIKTRDQK